MKDELVANNAIEIPSDESENKYVYFKTFYS